VATYAQISDKLTEWLLKWAANSNVTLANKIWDDFHGNKIDEFEAVKRSPDDFAKLRGNPQQALVDLVTSFQEINIPFTVNSGSAGTEVQEAKERSPNIDPFFITQLREVVGDLIKFGGQQLYRPEQTVRNIIVRLRAARSYRDEEDD
jgi:hypothetical protein